MTRWPAAIAFSLSCVLFLAGLLQRAEWWLLDARANLTSRVVASDLVIVEIDARSLRELNGWPWPRRYHAELIKQLRAAGAQQVFIDIDFSSHSTADDDRLLAESLRLFERDRIMLPVFKQAFASENRQDRFLITQPAAEFRNRVALASITLLPERDGLIRRVPLTGTDSELGAQPAAMLLSGLRHAPADLLYIDYSIQPSSFARLSYADVLHNRFPQASVRGKKVIVGASALELGDELAVPLYRSLSGPVLQAMAYQSVRQGILQPTPVYLTVLAMLLLTLATAWSFSRLGWRIGLLAAAGIGSALFVLSLITYSQQRLIVDLAPLLTVVIACYSSTMLVRLDQQSWRIMFEGAVQRRLNALMTNVVQNSIDGIITIDNRGVIREINPAALHMFGFRDKAIVGQPFNKVVPDSHDSTLIHAIPESATSCACVQEAYGRHRDGHTFPIEIAISRLSFDEQSLYTAFVRDISERKVQQATLEHQASHDSLTGLANRALLQERLEHMTLPRRQPAQGAAVLMLDLNRFKEINDTLGHHVGDLVLKEVASRLAAGVDPKNTLARFGGDEFAILIPRYKERDELIAVALEILKSLETPVDANGFQLVVGISIGIAIFPDDGRTPATLLQCADVAMYLAKNSHSGYAMYDPKLDQNSVHRLTLTTDLRSAIDSDQLTLFYQPQVDLGTGEVVCFEALLRWTHPTLGLVPPIEIIDVTEGTELIHPLTIWTLRRALQDTALWHKQGCRCRVAVNLSARLLHDFSFPGTLKQCLRDLGTDPDKLILEVTESAIVSDPDHALKIAQQIAETGVHLSLDDFGTGYSSLSYLKNLPAYELKIDKGFVLDMGNSQSDSMIVRSTIDLAHNLGMRVVAEGVETRHVWNDLRKLGCDIAQGYWIGRPLPLDEIPVWLEAWKDRRSTLK